LKKFLTPLISIALYLILLLGLYRSPAQHVHAQSSSPGNYYVYLPSVMNRPTSPSDNWPQLGRDPQRTNWSPEQIDPPFCYAWKWYAVPFASRAQPVVKDGRFYLGGLDGVLYARDATTGAPVWSYKSSGPIRNSPGVYHSIVIFSSYDGFTYGLDASNGALIWKTSTGPSVTAPLIDESHGAVYVASSNGILTGLNAATGAALWHYDSGAPILTSPSLSQDGSLVFFGNEAIQAIAVQAGNGAKAWQTTLQGQSLADRYPVVAGSTVFYRSEPLYFFHWMLQQYGDNILDQAGSVNPDWNTDWSLVKPQIISFLTGKPAFQTFFTLNASNGSSRGVAPVLYTFGSQDTPAVPVVAGTGQVYVAYRPRHGIQTDNGAVHVTTRYDAELGVMNLSSLDITGLRNSNSLWNPLKFRMTSDEGGMLTMSGNFLLVDNWERLGGINVSNGQLAYVGNVSNDWPECDAQCGPGGPNPYFPLSGNPNDPAYPFPGPRTGEGHARAGAIIANQMIYWHVLDAGIAAISHQNGAACPPPKVWRDSVVSLPSFDPNSVPTPGSPTATFQDYVKTDMTGPVPITPQNTDLVNRLRNEVRALIQTANGQHLLPYFVERGFSTPYAWPYTLQQDKSISQYGIAQIAYQSQGTAYWFEPGDLLYTLAAAYPYLDNDLKASAKSYMASEMNWYPPLQDLPYSSPPSPWISTGSQRELYAVPFRNAINNWPPVGANMQTIYALWLWSKNTGDYSYAQNHWSQIQNLFNNRKGSIRYYSDIAGAIGFYRLADHLGQASDASAALSVAVNAMQNGASSFQNFVSTANADYLDPQGFQTGWSAPVFFGMTPEVGAYMADYLGGAPQRLIISLETLNSSGRGMLWWYLTRVGEHGEPGETSFLAPITAWSHFLAHAYILHDSQSKLRNWLDRPWAPGDLFSIQKIVATIQANQ